MYEPKNTAAALSRSGPDGSLTERNYWSYTGPEGATDVVANYGPPVVADGRLVVHLMAWYSQGDEQSVVGELLALDGESWTVEWRQGTVRGGPVSPVVADGTLSVAGTDQDRAYVFAVDAATGDVVWQSQTAGLCCHTPVTADRVAAVSAGAVDVFDRHSGDRLGAATSPDWELNPAPHQCLAGNAVVTSGPGGIRRLQG